MIKVAIVEDDREYCGQLKDYLSQYEKEYHTEFDVSVFYDGDGLLQKVKAQFDIILLDIQMPLVDGITAAKEIRKSDSKVIIIFVTTVAQYAIKGYEVGALDYILKPVAFFPFSQSLKKACMKLEKNEKAFLSFRVKSGIRRVNIDDIYYIESLRHVLCIHISARNFESYGTMKYYEEQLRQYNFSRGNKGYLINLKYVSTVEENKSNYRNEPRKIIRNKIKQMLKRIVIYRKRPGLFP